MYTKTTTYKVQLIITFQKLVQDLHTPEEKSREKPKAGLGKLSQIMSPTEENRDLKFGEIYWDHLGKRKCDLPAVCKGTVQFLVLKVE